MLIYSNRRHSILLIASFAATAACIACASIDMACAQGAFGVGMAHFPAPADDGPFGWVLAKQAAYYRDFSGVIRASKLMGPPSTPCSACHSLTGSSTPPVRATARS
jgi:hypothetical protein